MAYLGNLICKDCGLTFTARWGSHAGAFEFRCESDHVLHVHPDTGAILSIDGVSYGPVTLLELHGLCPWCETEVASGLLPACPVCGGRDHQTLIEGQLL
jgi:hypothetical protein